MLTMAPPPALVQQAPRSFIEREHAAARTLPPARPASSDAPRSVRARYDAAQSTDNNRRHWLQADSLSSDAANSAPVRQILRNRSRYEADNNSYYGGIVRTLAGDTIGRGPRLQLTEKTKKAAKVERDFANWAKKVKLGRKLRTMSMAWTKDGEAFGIQITNPKVDHVVKLDVNLIEAEQVASPWQDANPVDGIKLDANGNPESYSVLKEHPGSTGIGAVAFGEYSTVPAQQMIHIFSAERPGQHRGIPRMMSSLPLWSQLRRFTLATLTAAETAADFAGVVQTDAPADDENKPTVKALEQFELERGLLLSLPAGWKFGQANPVQPATTYPDFMRKLVGEGARPINMPYNIAASDSSGYNYSSGRLDHKTYYKTISIDQDDFETIALDPILESWLREYELATGVRVSPDHQWYWDGDEHIDPVKEATADQIELEDGTTTYKDVYAAKGKDWETQFEQRALEKKRMKELDILPAQTKTPPPPPAQPPADEQGGSNA